MPQIKFEKQFGKGTDPWYAKAERWAKKQKNPLLQNDVGGEFGTFGTE